MNRNFFKLFAFVLFIFPFISNAAIITWDGGGGDNDWTTCANWSTDTCPLSTDDAYFDSGSNKNVVISTSVTVQSFAMYSGYTGSIAITGGSLQVNGDYYQDTGTITLSSATTTFAGSFTYSGGTFNHNGGTVLFQPTFHVTYLPTTAQFNDVVFDTVSGFNYETYLASDMHILGDAEFKYSVNTYGRTYKSVSVDVNRTIYVSGNVSYPSTPGTGTISFGYYDGSYPITVDVKGNFSLEDSGVILFSKFNFSSSSNQTINKTAGTIYNTSEWYDSGSGNLILSSDFAGDMTLNSDNDTDFNFVPSPYTFTARNIVIGGTGSFTPRGASQYNFTEFNLGAGTFNANASSTFINFTQSGGVFNASTATTTVIGSMAYTGGTFNHNNGVFHFIPSETVAYTPNGAIFNTVVFESNGSANRDSNFYSDMVINGDVTFIQSPGHLTRSYRSNLAGVDRVMTIGGNTYIPQTGATGGISFGYYDGTYQLILDMKGNVSIEDSNFLWFSDARFTGSGTQTIKATAGNLYDTSEWLINKPTGSTELLSTIYHTGGIIVATGTLNLKGYNLTGLSSFSVASSSTLELFGNETVSTPTLASGSTVVYSGTSGPYTLKNFAYKNLTINSPLTTFTLPGTTVVAETLTIATGTLDVTGSNHALSVGKNWINGGTFNARAGTVTLNGTNQTIIGSSTFYNLTKTVSSPDTLRFEANKTQSISNTWTMQGASGNILSLRSTQPGTQWRVKPEATRTLSYISVQDSNNIDSSVIETSASIQSAGNNTNWNFDTTPPSVSSVVATSTASTITIGWNTNESATSFVQYGTSLSYGSASTSPATSTHQVILSGLNSNTQYNYRIISTDPYGNAATSSNYTISTLDVTPPQIEFEDASSTTFVESKTPTSVTITFMTDENASSTVEYGLTESYGSSITSSGTTLHTVVLTGLLPDTTYCFRIIVEDASQNVRTSSNQTVITLSAPIVQSQAAVQDFSKMPRFGNEGPVIAPQVTIPSKQKFVFTYDLQFGMKNSAVKELQKFLNAQGFTISQKGIGSLGMETDYFGVATRNAVIKFQKAKKIIPTNGRFGPLTRKIANEIK